MGREGILFLYHAFGGLVGSFIASYAGMCSYLAQGGVMAFLVPGMDEGYDVVQEQLMGGVLSPCWIGEEGDEDLE